MNDPDSKPERESSGKEKESAESPSEDTPIEVLEAIKELPAQERKVISSLFAQISSVPSPSPIAKKVTSEHISQLINNSEKDNERAFQISVNAEITKRLVVAAILMLVGIVLVYAACTKDKELSEKIITVVISALGGVGVGFAVGKQDK